MEELDKQKQQTDNVITKISDRMDKLEEKIEALQQTMATAVATEITNKFTELEKKINENYTILEEMFKKTLTGFVEQMQSTGSPNRKKTKTVSPTKENEAMQE